MNTDAHSLTPPPPLSPTSSFFPVFQELDYRMVRSYNWKVKPMEDAGSAFFFTLRDGECTYNQLPHIVYLKKRRKRVCVRAQCVCWEPGMLLT